MEDINKVPKKHTGTQIFIGFILGIIGSIVVILGALTVAEAMPFDEQSGNFGLAFAGVFMVLISIFAARKWRAFSVTFILVALLLLGFIAYILNFVQFT